MPKEQNGLLDNKTVSLSVKILAQRDNDRSRAPRAKREFHFIPFFFFIVSARTSFLYRLVSGMRTAKSDSSWRARKSRGRARERGMRQSAH